MRVAWILGVVGFAIAAGAGVAPMLGPGTKHSAVVSEKKKFRFDEEEEEKNAGPLDAYKWRSLAWRDNKGYIDPQGLQKALRHRTDVARYSAFRTQEKVANLGISWQNPGPTNISGRCRSLIFDPLNPKLIIEGSVGGGLWRSTDAGQTFSPINDLLPNLAINCLIRDPSQSRTIYAGTGEGFYNSDAIQGSGIYKSTDNGATWNLMPGTAKDFPDVNRIAIAPGIPTRMLVATPNGVLLSTDGGVTFANEVRGLATYVAFNPHDPKKAVASVLAGAGYTAFYTIDGGLTWSPCTGLVNVALVINGFSYGFYGRLELAYAPSSPNIVYATNPVDQSIYKSIDGGASYSKATTSGAIQFNNQQWYDNALWVSPTDPNLLAAAGVNVWRSTDGGVTLKDIGDTYNGFGFQPHPDIHGLFSSPKFNGSSDKALYVCCDGGVFMTDDILKATAFPTDGVTTGWSSVGKTITTQFYSVAGEANSGYILGGTQDNGTEQIIGSNGTASYVFGGDGGYVAIDPKDPGYQYGEYVDLSIFRTTNGGGDSTFITQNLPDAFTNANFIAPFILDPNDSNKLWAGGGQLWLSENVKTAEVPNFRSVRLQGTDLISAVAVATGNSNVVWVGQNDGFIQRTSNGLSAKPNWTTVRNVTGSTTNQFARMITRILIDPTDPTSNTVYVALGGYGTDNFWKTTDGGITWKDLVGTGSSGLPLAPIRGIAQDPSNPKSIFVGTEVGVFWSLDGGNSWLTSNVAPSNVSVDELSFMKNSRTLLAGTHGRGLWIGTLAGAGLNFTPSTIYSSGSTTGSITLGAPAPKGGTRIALSSDSPNLVIPASVLVPAGSLGTTFTARATVTTSTVTANVTAKFGSNRPTAVVTIQPAGLTGFTLSTQTINGGAPTVLQLRATIDGPAPSGGATILLDSSDPTIVVPPTLTIPAGATSVSFVVPHQAVDQVRIVKITASRGTTSIVATLTIIPAPITSFTLSTLSVVAGNNFTGTVAVNTAIPTAGQPIGISQTFNPDNGRIPVAVNLPFDPKIAGGTRSGTFTFGTNPVKVAVDELIYVVTGYNAIRPLPIKIVPASLGSLALDTNGTNVIVTLNGGAYAGYKVNLTSDNKLVMFGGQLSTSVTFTAGQRTATVPITTTKPLDWTTIHITGTDGTVTQTLTFELGP